METKGSSKAMSGKRKTEGMSRRGRGTWEDFYQSTPGDSKETLNKDTS